MSGHFWPSNFARLNFAECVKCYGEDDAVMSKIVVSVSLLIALSDSILPEVGLNFPRKK